MLPTGHLSPWQKGCYVRWWIQEVSNARYTRHGTTARAATLRCAEGKDADSSVSCVS